MFIYAERYHDFSAGHRVAGHESKCASLHGHNYRVHFKCAAPGLDSLGRVLDFGFIKSYLCQWLEEQWDHKFLLWDRDPWRVTVEWPFQDPPRLEQQLPHGDGVVLVPFNPTAENMAKHLLAVVGPQQLEPFSKQGVRLVAVRVEETRKCGATASLLFNPDIGDWQ